MFRKRGQPCAPYIFDFIARLCTYGLDIIAVCERIEAKPPTIGLLPKSASLMFRKRELSSVPLSPLYDWVEDKLFNYCEYILALLVICKRE